MAIGKPEKFLTTKHPFSFQTVCGADWRKNEFRQNQPTLSSWFKVVDANSRNLNLESKPQERPKRPETSRVFKKLFKNIPRAALKPPCVFKKLSQTWRTEGQRNLFKLLVVHPEMGVKMKVSTTNNLNKFLSASVRRCFRKFLKNTGRFQPCPLDVLKSF